jgi:heme exporter protein B
LKKLLAVTLKDLRSEARAKEIAPAMVLFAIVLVFLLSFTLPPGAGRAPVPEPVAGAVASRDIAGTLMWAALLFAGIVGFGRSAAAEREAGRLDALLLAPVDSAALFGGKALANFIYISLMEWILIPVFLVFIDLELSIVFPEIVLVAILVNVGLSSAGTLFGAASQYARAREVLLPLIAFPVMLPAILAGSKLTSSLMTTGTLTGQARWFVLLVVFDLSITALGAVTFEYVIRE